MKAMKKMNYLTALAAIVLPAGLLAQQDFHLSQWDAATQYMNPALAGMYAKDKGDYKITSAYRSQWKSLGVRPYKTIYLAYDQPYENWDKKFGVGGYISNNRGGVGKFNTMNMMFTGAYDITHKGAGEHYLTTGLQMGLMYKSFRQDDYTYDIQYSYDEGGFDESIPHGEAYDKTGLLRFDANWGIYYKYMENGENVYPFFGFSVQHITKPRESFNGMDQRLPMRFNFNMGADVKVNEQLKVVPKVLYMNQKRAHEFNAGALAFYNIEATYYDVIFGFDYRHKDAVVIDLGIKHDNHIFRFSYDINTSYLKNYSRSRGAWEFSLILTGEKGKPLFDTSKF